VIISPDAELNFVNLAILLDRQDKFLAEQYTIKYVSSGRDLVFGRKAGKGTRRLSVFANPAFGEKPGTARKSDTNMVQLAMLAADQRDYAGVNLPPLPGTAIEAGYLRDKCAGWKLEGAVYEGAEASEAEVRAVKSPYILHLATHGFFLPDTEPTNRPDLGMRILNEGRLPVVWHNPMQRSGLAFAGAQLTLEAWKRGEMPDSENDGILMAQEVGTMDLKGTWLVVLSACDTGAGEAQAGEGVLGLRRGFIQAGAQNLMMTLWPVSDKWTVEMMKAFYERALKDGDAPGALAQVQREYLVKLREEKNPVMAARLAGPFILTFQGPLKN
jgi:CHAT domain-containing protein